LAFKIRSNLSPIFFRPENCSPSGTITPALVQIPVLETTTPTAMVIATATATAQTTATTTTATATATTATATATTIPTAALIRLPLLKQPVKRARTAMAAE